MRNAFRRAPSVIGWATLLLAGASLPSTLAGEPTARPQWEYKAVAFARDEVENTARLNALARNGWEYVGPLAHGQVAFRRAAGSANSPPKAVYLVSGKGPPAKERERHPEVRIVHTFADLKRAASQRTAVWIDAGAIGLLGENGKEWVIQKSRQKYPFVLVGYNNALYSFREQLDCFLISGPGPIDWSQYQLTPGFSVIMLEEKRLEDGAIEVSGPMRGYKQEPSFDAILGVTNRLLAGESLPER
jgi:hypothetical protein